MKGPFGLLLIGGGIILIVGLFTGKIAFTGTATAPTPAAPDPHKTPIIGGKNTSCPSGYILGADGKCYSAVGI
jgi:hypothetical protein